MLAALDGVGDRRLLEVRVEVVGEMHAIDVVAIDHFQNGVEDRPARGGNSRIDPHRLPVAPHPLRVRARHVSGDRLAEIVGRHRAEGIEPDVELEAVSVRLVDGQRQGIIAVVLA